MRTRLLAVALAVAAAALDGSTHGASSSAQVVEQVGEAVTTRLVVDTGMNALGWPRSKAVDFMRENLMETDTQIHTESLRYSVDIPGQALAYKMGAVRIRELREKARGARGDRFDIRRFHDAVLGSGSLPMTTLERHLGWFVEQERKRER